jgi:hypothetical protein
LLLISWWIVFNPTPFLEGAKGKKKMIHGSSSSSWCCYLLVPSRWNFLPYPKNKRNRSNFIIYSGGSTKYQLLFIFADSGRQQEISKKEKKKERWIAPKFFVYSLGIRGSGWQREGFVKSGANSFINKRREYGSSTQ